MTSIPVLFKVQSFYQNDDLSRFRSAMTMNTLAVSLAKQKDQNFFVQVVQDPADKQAEKRSSAFAKYFEGADVVATEARIEIEIQDDDFLSPEFISKIKQIPAVGQNSFITVPNGYCLRNGSLRSFRNQPDRIQVSLILDVSQPVRDTVDGPTDPLWIHVRHNYSDVMETPEMTKGNAISSLNWPGWKQELVARYAEVQLKSATSAGVTVQFPRRVVYAGKRQKSNRGK
jgi:hypothetical protein